jgi:type II secretory pathway component PulF
VKLTSQQLSLLLNEVAAMARADRPLAIGLAELNHRSLGRIGRAAALLTKRMESGQSIDVAIQEISGRFGPQAAAALQSMQLTGSAEPVTQLAETLRRQSHMQMQWLVSLIYPMITVLAGYLLLSTLMTTLVIDHWPSEIVGKKNSTQFIAFCVWLREHFWLPPLIFGALALFVILTGSLGLIPWTKYSRSATDQAWSTFCDMLAIQIAADVPLAEAVKLSADATGSGVVRNAISISNHQLTIKSAVPPLIRWLLNHESEHTASDTAMQLGVIGDWYRYQSLRRCRFWISYVPAAITVLAGGSAALLYCYVLLPPLFDGLERVVK